MILIRSTSTQLRLAILALCALILISLSCVNAVPAQSTTRRQNNQLPDLSETLAVAKSPYEPVTLPPGTPDARNGEPAPVSSGESLVSAVIEHKQSTRAAQSDEQEGDIKGTSEASDSDSSRSTQSVENTTPAESLEADGATTANEMSELESETSTTPKSEPFVTTESSSTTEATTTVQPTRSAESIELSTTTTTTASPIEETSAMTTTTTASNISEEADRSSSTNPSAENESAVKDQSEPSTTEAEKVQSGAPSIATTITTTTTSFTVTEIPETTSKPTSSTPSAIETSSTSSTNPPGPVTPSTTTEQAPSSTPPSSTTPSSTPSSSTPSSKVDEAKDEISKASNCNHLPNYDGEEVQKVFREETTYKNGTIRGKFTYINFDQRYRLVHYTRLPYGPVKIDQVEELGKPEQNGTTSGSSSAGEIPNSVLQLRNILPNSLFGFPFLGPANKPIEPKESLPSAANNNGHADTDRSNMYFYSTDSISTPNLLSPSVPVSLLPGQRRSSQPASNSAIDTLRQSFYENLPVGNIQEPTGTTARKFKLQTPEKLPSTIGTSDGQRHSTSVAVSDPNQLRFQYALAAQSPELPKQEGLVYSYSVQPQSQYQYSPLPVYTFPQPSYFSAQRQHLIPQPYRSPYSSEKLLQTPDQHLETSTFASQHQVHQPYSHEHYVAPFMFAQPPASSGARQLSGDDQVEPPKFRLKLKTAKTSNVRQDSIKSAQLRSPAQSVPYSAPINSPVQVHKLQHRQRAGKQNHDLKPAYNSSPIVYHVLRSPVGRMYTLPQYHQSHSMAYDQDD